MKEFYEPLQVNVLTLDPTSPISLSSDHDNGNVDIGDLPLYPGDE